MLSGVDTVVMARTGSGKTCAFLIPLVEKLLAERDNGRPQDHQGRVRAIILSPTRELSVQTLKVLLKLAAVVNNHYEDTVTATTKVGGNLIIRPIGINGGESMEKQFDLLANKKPNVIVATPGRLAHHLEEIPDFTLSHCTMCILDEADRLFEMGFSLQIRQIAKHLPSSSGGGGSGGRCQKLLFSATMPKVLVEFTKTGFLQDPSVVRLDQEATVSDELRIAFITCRSADKDAAMLHILQQQIRPMDNNHGRRTGLTLIFAATRHHVEYISALLSASGIGASKIYGTMDQEARKMNLGAFRSGQKPVLVVTDVAARGIDVPLCDHVLHYHFPPSPKLFVHRSGRVARAGRIGYCWALVEPDEMAYMMDLHLFLGRRPSAGIENQTNESRESEENSGSPTQALVYSIDEMTPDMVHYGSIPELVLTDEVESVQRLLNSELSGSSEAETLRSLTRVCQNAMKLYRRTRVEASKEGVRRAKAVLEGERLETGERINSGSIPPHPLLRHALLKVQDAGDSKGVRTAENAVKREEFLRAMSNFRPKETVFEAFATGGAKDVGIVSQVDRGRTSNSSKKQVSSFALSAMKDMRRQMRMARDKGSTLIVAGSAATEDDLTTNTDDISGSVRDNVESDNGPTKSGPELIPPTAKRRISRAERRKLKKKGSSVPSPESRDKSTPAKAKRGSDFRDPSFFIENDFTSNDEEARRSRQVEAAMQPSASAQSKAGAMGSALRIEETMLDLLGDENEDIIRKQRIMRWDKSKRKYMQSTVGEELRGDSKSKRMRIESGQVIKSDKLKLGEAYEKWQKKTNRSIGRTGVFDDADGPAVSSSKLTANPEHDEARTLDIIKKERARKQNLKIKNMKRSERRVLEKKQRDERARTQKKGKLGGRNRS